MLKYISVCAATVLCSSVILTASAANDMQALSTKLTSQIQAVQDSNLKALASLHQQTNEDIQTNHKLNQEQFASLEAKIQQVQNNSDQKIATLQKNIQQELEKIAKK